MIKSIYLTGVGGQGVVTMANMISAHLQRKEIKATLIHSTGMAQRGGRVASEIRFSDDSKASFGPRISAGKADFMIGMDMCETINSIDFIKDDGCLIYSDYTLVSSQAVIKKERIPDSREVSELFENRCGLVVPVTDIVNPANMYLLGAFTAVCWKDRSAGHLFDPEEFEETLKHSLKKRIEENLETFRRGVETGRNK